VGWVSRGVLCILLQWSVLTTHVPSDLFVGGTTRSSVCGSTMIPDVDFFGLSGNAMVVRGEWCWWSGVVVVVVGDEEGDGQ
jgi:hypothetical protein